MRKSIMGVQLTIGTIVIDSICLIGGCIVIVLVTNKEFAVNYDDFCINWSDNIL